ncbi:MAG: adenylate kinase [Alphaproteobacteria bacterium]
MSVNGFRLVLLGPPGAGKGTQAALLAKHFAVPHVSTGEILRHEIDRGSDLGGRARQYMDKGELVPDQIMLGIIRERLSQADCTTGVLLDGFPRSLPQAAGLEEIFAPEHVPMRAVSLDVPSDEIVRRLSGRRTCRDCGAMFHVSLSPPKKPGICDLCGGELYQRDDDREAIIQARLEVYRKETEPLMAFYRERSVLRAVDGTGSSRDVFRRVVEELEGAPA